MAKAKDAFQEVSKLAKVMDVWGKNALSGLTEDIYAAVEARAEKDNSYSVQDYQAYMAAQENPAAVGYEKATQETLKTLREGDKNVSLVLQFMNAAQAKTYLPEIENKAEIQKLADKYGINSLKKLLG